MTNIRELIESTRLEIAEFEKSIPLIEKTQGEHDELNRLINQTQDDESKLLGQHSADIDQQTEKLLEIRARRDVLKSRLNGSVDDCWERSYALGGIAFQNYDRLCACYHQRAREASPDKTVSDIFSFGLPRIQFGEWVNAQEKFSRRRSIIFNWEQELSERFIRLSAALLAMEGEPKQPAKKA